MEIVNNARWWETYLVRYITGSVVGAVIVYVVLWKAGLDLIPCFDEIKNSNLLVLLALGFAYCYLASAPIALLHAMRSMFDKTGGIDVSKTNVGLLLAFVVILSTLLAWGTYQYLWGLTVCVGLLLCYVYFLAVNSFRKRKSDEKGNQWQFWYHKLAISREKGAKEFIESYRHLREHGNAFFIVILEIALAIPLFMIVSLSINMEMKIGIMLTVTLVWLSTGMVCWMLGNTLEQYLIDTPSLQNEQKTPKVQEYRRFARRHYSDKR